MPGGCASERHPCLSHRSLPDQCPSGERYNSLANVHSSNIASQILHIPSMPSCCRVVLTESTYCATSATGTACLKDLTFDWTGAVRNEEDTNPSARTATSFLPGSIAIGQGTDGNLRRVGNSLISTATAASTLFKQRVGDRRGLESTMEAGGLAQRPRSSQNLVDSNGESKQQHACRRRWRRLTRLCGVASPYYCTLVGPTLRVCPTSALVTAHWFPLLPPNQAFLPNRLSASRLLLSLLGFGSIEQIKARVGF